MFTPTTGARRRRMVPLLPTVLITVLLTILLVACGSEDSDNTGPVAVDFDTVTDVTVITAGHQGSPATGLPAAYLDVISDALAQGTPVTLSKITGTAPEVKRVSPLSDGASKMDRKAELADILGAVQGVVAAAPATAGADPLEALAATARTSTTGSLILVNAPLLSDSGVLDLAAQPGLVQADPDSIVSDLADSGHLPDFADGATVVLTGIGAVADPQETVSAKNITALTDMWSAIITAGGAHLQVLPAQASSGASSNADAPTVTPVAFPDEEALNFACGTQTVSLTEADGMRFSPESASFTDQGAATAAIADIADALAAAPGGEVVVTGYTVEDDSGAKRLRTLGASRADAVKTLLVDALPAGAGATITTRGVGGREAADYRADRNRDGTLNDAAAVDNRRVDVTVTKAPC